MDIFGRLAAEAVHALPEVRPRRPSRHEPTDVGPEATKLAQVDVEAAVPSAGPSDVRRLVVPERFGPRDFAPDAPRLPVPTEARPAPSPPVPESPSNAPRRASAVAPTRSSPAAPSPAAPSTRPLAPTLPAAVARIDVPAEPHALVDPGAAVRPAADVTEVLRPETEASEIAESHQPTEPAPEAPRDASDPSLAEPEPVDPMRPLAPGAEPRRPGSAADLVTWERPTTTPSAYAAEPATESPDPAVVIDRVPPTLPTELPLAILAPPRDSERGAEALGRREDPPVVRVTIGRIEVRAPPAEPASLQVTAPPALEAPRLSLDDYLERRKAGWG